LSSKLLECECVDVLLSIHYHILLVFSCFAVQTDLLQIVRYILQHVYSNTQSIDFTG